MTGCEQILAGCSDIRNYNINIDFDNQEIGQDWYPVGNSLKNGRHSYYYDPQSLYAPGDPGNN